MKTKNAMSLKALINKKAEELHTLPQIVFQNYIMECLLNRISRSPYKDNFILKGGFLISSMIGLASRSTMDMDTTVSGITLSKSEIAKMTKYICDVPAEDDFTFVYDRVEDIRETDDYPGLRVFLFADYEKIHAPFSIDVTTGDKITPAPTQYSYKRLFDTTPISVLSYPLETVLAEKIETILSRNIANTRLRDFYDVYILKPFAQQSSNNLIRSALENTAKKRKTEKYISEAKNLLDEIEHDKTMLDQWSKYTKQRPYAAGISFESVCDSIRDILQRIGI